MQCQQKLYVYIFYFHNSLNIKRWKCGLVALGNSLFAIGGMDSPKAGHWGNPLKTVERYDPNLDKWTEVASMNEARFGSAVVTYQVYITLFCTQNRIIFFIPSTTLKQFNKCIMYRSLQPEKN